MIKCPNCEYCEMIIIEKKYQWLECPQCGYRELLSSRMNIEKENLLDDDS